jgi:hypothetical protein
LFPTLSNAGHRKFVISDLDEKGLTGFGLLISEENDEYKLLVGRGESTESVKTGFKIITNTWTHIQFAIPLQNINVTISPKKKLERQRSQMDARLLTNYLRSLVHQP